MDSALLASLLSRVEKPARYLGNEVNVIRKDFDKARVRVALVFPDAYEIGMSHMGLKILYDILNNIPDVVAERCYAPWPDMEKILRDESIPLFSLESKRPLKDFDIIGFSLTYELTYTNMVNMLRLAHIPVWQKDRNASHPLIIAGGGCMNNAEPVADFLDAACLGDGEELIVDIVNVVRSFKEADKNPTQKLFDQLAKIEGVYIPSFFTPEYNDDQTLAITRPLKEGYTRINRRILKEIDSAPYPTAILVPNVKPVHDRIGIEIQRGCNRACRFCQAGYIDRPVRQRSPETVLRIAEESYKNTGIDEISLLSLSAADYACLVPLLAELNDRYARRKVSLSVPATRVEKMTPELIEQIKKVRKTGFTIAPEAGSPRMRRVINKGNKVDDLYQAVHNAFSQGWQLLKMYYMVGLPFETDDDVEGIARESRECHGIALGYTRKAELNTSVSSFVPKPHTPFQWEPQQTIAETHRKHDLVRRNLGDRRIHFKHHSPQMSWLEGILSRGDRRVAELIYLAVKEGCVFDEWQEYFDFLKWERALQKWSMDPAFYLHRKRDKSEVLPWDHLFAQMDKKFLWEEYEKAHDEAYTEDCSVARCSDCGVCDFRNVKNKIFVVGDQPVMVKKGNREAYGWGGLSPLSVTDSQEAVSTIEEPKVINTPSFKIRVQYSKTNEARFLGHLELMDALKRAITRMGAPVKFSEGFHPQMRISMSQALSLGIESHTEFFELDLSSEIDIAHFKSELNKALPIGVQILLVEVIDRKGTALYSAPHRILFEAVWEGEPSAWPSDYQKKLADFDLASEVVLTKNSGKQVNLKEFVEIDSQIFPQKFRFFSKTGPEGSIKPQEVVRTVFGLNDLELSKIRLTKTEIHPLVQTA